MSMQLVSNSVLGLASFLMVFGIAACKKKETTAPAQDPLAIAEQNLKTSPSFDNHISLGLAYANRGMRDQALDMYTKAKDLNPNSPLAWNNMCAELNAQKRHAEALPNCEKAVQLDGKFTLAKNNLQWTQAKLAETKATVADRKKKLLAQPSVKSAELMALGFDFYNLKDYAQSAEVWGMIKSTDAEYSKAQNNMATSYILNNQLGLAETHIGIALKLEPTNQLFLNNKNWLNQKKSAKK